MNWKIIFFAVLVLVIALMFLCIKFFDANAYKQQSDTSVKALHQTEDTQNNSIFNQNTVVFGGIVLVIIVLIIMILRKNQYRMHYPQYFPVNDDNSSDLSE